MSLAAACTSSEVDPCAATAGHAFVADGSAELGTGTEFTPVMDGQRADVVLGTQGLRMFVLNVRVRDLDVGPGQDGGITASARDQDGVTASMDYGCRTRSFEQHADGWLYATSAYFLPLTLDALAWIDGATVALQVHVRDGLGHEATDTRTVVAHLVP
jgi:hypothetical protein